MTTTLLVRRGADERLRKDPETGAEQHTLPNVYREMLLQICSDYPGLPDPRTLTMTEIRFFYEGLRANLKKHTAPKSTQQQAPPNRPPRRR
ncbi:MAG: hypothetical protein ACOC9T_00530 [Myxococcota bacterium]